MIGPVKVLPKRFFIFFFLLTVFGLLRTVKTTGVVGDAATVDQTDMRGLGTA